MSRENQGLQIALIIFAMLTVLLGVTAFVATRHYQDASGRAAAMLAQSLRSQRAAQERQDEVNHLKRIIGVSPTAKLSMVRQQFSDDTAAHAESFPEEDRCYRNVLLSQENVIRRQNAELDECRRRIQQWQARFERLEPSKQVQVTRHRAATEETEKDLADVLATSREHRKEMTDDNAAMQRALVEIRLEADRNKAEAAKQLEDLREQYRRVVKELETLRVRHRTTMRDDSIVPIGTGRE